MDRVNRILNNPEYKERLDTIDRQEVDRIYCKHSIDHLLSVARIMYIEVLERHLDIDREIVYAAALLHDIGRSVSNEHHDIESAKIAVHILELAGYNKEEIEKITSAILAHREGDESLLGDLLYRADKASRDCYYCEASGTCKWKVKNEGIIR